MAQQTEGGGNPRRTGDVMNHSLSRSLVAMLLCAFHSSLTYLASSSQVVSGAVDTLKVSEE